MSRNACVNSRRSTTSMGMPIVVYFHIVSFVCGSGGLATYVDG